MDPAEHRRKDHNWPCYTGMSSSSARRALVLVRTAHSLLALPRKRRTLSLLTTASKPIAEALGWPDAVFGRQHVERDPRVRRIYHRVRFGPAAATTAASAPTPSAAGNRENQRAAKAEDDAHAARLAEVERRLAQVRVGNAVQAAREFANLWGLTLQGGIRPADTADNTTRN